MKRDKRHVYIILLFLFLGLCCSCSSNDSPYDYSRAPQNNESNLNMKGEPLRATSTEDMARIQGKLHYLGYDPGPITGCCGPQTKRAIKRFQMEHGIQSDGAVGPLTEQSIRKALHARTTLQKGTPRGIKSQQGSLP